MTAIFRFLENSEKDRDRESIDSIVLASFEDDLYAIFLSVLITGLNQVESVRFNVARSL
jgi:hypothetical protein